MLLGVGFGAISIALATPAFAQDSTATPTAPAATTQSTTPPQDASAQEITVTGVRASVSSALELKRTATQLQESIVAEDIGKLPDNNVVEALQHVTGVSIVRNTVEPGTVLIRGLPDVTTTLSGREIFSSSSRSISLPDFPAELLARVDVKKSSSADDIEGGIAGTINVELHRPFDFPGLEVAGSVKGTYGTLSKKWAPDASLLLSNRWDTGAGEFGIMLDGSYQKRLVSTDRMDSTQRALKVAGVADAGTGPAVGVPPGSVAVPFITRMTQADTVIDRRALNASLQWRPDSGKMQLYADYFYSQLRNEAPVDVDLILNGTCPNPAGYEVFPGTNVPRVMQNGCYALTSMQDRRTRENTQQLATGGNWDVSDHLTVKAEGNYTWSDTNTISYIPDAQYNLNSMTDGATVTFNPYNKGGAKVDQPGNPQLNPADTYLDQWYDTRAPGKGHEWAGRIDANYLISDTSFIRSIDVGYRYNSRNAVSDSTGTGLNCAASGDGSNPYNKFIVAASNSPACVAYRDAALPQPFSTNTATHVGGVSYSSLGQDAYHRTRGSFFGGRYGTDAWVNMDQAWVWQHVEDMRALFGYSGPLDLIPTNHFDVTETGNAGYLKANYAFDFGGMTIDGNIGVRVVKTKLTEKAFTQQYVPLDPSVGPTQGVNATCITCIVYTPVTATKTDTQVLPSFNLRWKLIDGLYLRAAAGKTVTRPTFAQLNPGLTVRAANAVLLGSASSGNPDLSPVKSTNYDLDLSYYWNRVNHLTAAVFYREVTGYIQTRQTAVVIQGQDYVLSRPENYQNAKIKGLELGYSQFLTFLPGFLSGFGWDVNATFIDAPFNNVAKRHLNASAIYEKGPVSLRLSYTYNSPYRVGDFGSGAQPQFTEAAVRTNMDFSANYTINDNLTVSFDATNLLDSYQREYAGSGAENALLWPVNLSRYDRTYAVGLRFKF
jgi:TonB-dependent receptor